jgi:hypothetical protein
MDEFKQDLYFKEKSMHISLEIDYNAVQYFYRNFDGGYKE